MSSPTISAPAMAGPTTSPATDPMTAGSGLVGSGLVKVYEPAKRDVPPALAGVEVAIAPGESVAIMGASGSGKTTLLHVLAGIVRPTAGTVSWRGSDLGRMSDAQRSRLRRNDFGFVFQSGQLLPELPVIDNIALPQLLEGADRRAANQRAQLLLRPLGLDGLADRRPGELSGGQLQRVAIARALVGAPGVVFADEPTGALDHRTGQDVMAQLTAACAHHGASLVLVTHAPEVAAWCGRTLHMSDGQIIGEARR